jgi:hypothetical protein
LVRKNNSIYEHFAKVQLYRWFQLYEREMNSVRIANQLDILAEDVYIESPDIQTSGKENYPGRIIPYKHWKNAFHLKNVRVSELNLGIISVEAEILYQNIQEFGQKNSYVVRYKTEMEPRTEALPVFKKILLEPILKSKLTFEDTYPQNRIKSLIHYFFGNLEKLDGNTKPFKEILSDGFELNFLDKKLIDSPEKFESWLKKYPGQLLESRYTLKDYHIKQLEKDEFRLEMDIQWNGLSLDEVKLFEKIRHIWIIADDDSLPFAKIKQAKVEIL